MTLFARRKTLLPPGPGGGPFIGNALAFRRDQLGYLQRLQQTYSNMATIYMGNVPIVLFFRPEHVRYVLSENPGNFTVREIAGVLRQMIGDSLLTSDGDVHRQQRRLLQPAFHKKRIECYSNVMVQYALETIEGWHPGKEVDMSAAMQELTLRIVAKCLFNVDLARHIDALAPAFIAMFAHPIGLSEALLNVRIDQPFTAYGKRMAARREVDTFIYDLIAQRQADRQDMDDMLSTLLATREGTLTDTQLRDHIMTFLAAGHGTTANALTWIFYLLSEYPKVREKLLNELEARLAGRAPTPDDMEDLPYLEWALSESLRLYPPVWRLVRHAVAAFDLDGIHFPAGTAVMLSQWITHRLPDIWDDPNVFWPERWDPVSSEGVPHWAYFPFGGGPRTCMGMSFALLEAKLLLATILQRYTPLTLPNYRLELSPLITLSPKHGLPMTLVPASLG